jgi:hypothetical protein
VERYVKHATGENGTTITQDGFLPRQWYNTKKDGGAMMSNKPFNSRKYQGQLDRDLVIGAILILLIIGGGLIAVFWGNSAFFTALICFALSGGLIAVLWLFLKLLEWASRDR